MITKPFLNGILARTHMGMPLALVFSTNADVRLSMSTLLRLHNEGVLIIDRRDHLVVMAMAESGDFDHDENRNVHVHLRSREDLFEQLEPLIAFLDTIKHENDHPLQNLQSGRLKRREEALAQIKSSWISSALRIACTDWSMQLEVELESTDGFHMCKISIKDHTGREFTSMTLDGWSGLMRHNTRWLKDRQASAAQMNELLLEDIEFHVETATAA